MNEKTLWQVWFALFHFFLPDYAYKEQSRKLLTETEDECSDAQVLDLQIHSFDTQVINFNSYYPVYSDAS